jgi:hypothetical protein
MAETLFREIVPFSGRISWPGAGFLGIPEQGTPATIGQRSTPMIGGRAPTLPRTILPSTSLEPG